MKLVILAVGKGRSAPEAMLAESWMSRIHSGGSIIEVESKLPSGPDRQRDESARLLRHVDAGIPLAACDPRGRDTSSEALAAMIAGWRDAGRVEDVVGVESCPTRAGVDGMVGREEDVGRWPSERRRALCVGTTSNKARNSARTMMMDNDRERDAPDQCSRKLDPNDSSAGPPSTSTELLSRQSASCCPFGRQSPPSALAQPTAPPSQKACPPAAK